jgi:hypothetical protein
MAMTPRRLRLIGYWQSEHTLDWPDVAQFVDETWDAAERARVIGYLRGGGVVRRFWGVSACRLCGMENGRAEQSDGEWLWPDGLAHYLEAHQVRLPEEFLAHVREREGHVAEEEIDRSWWRAQRSRGGSASRSEGDETG